MARRGKKYVEIKKKQPKQALPLKEAIDAVKKLSYTKFKGTIELHLAVELPKDKEAKSIKGAFSLPHPVSTKDVKVAVFTSDAHVKDAEAAGADMYNLDQLMKDVKAGKIAFDVAIATPDVMPKIASLGRELGPRGLMPNPKTGTVTTDIKKTVEEYKKGKTSFACDESGVMHFAVGKVDTETEMIVENVISCLDAAAEVIGKRRETVSRTAHLSATMGPSVEVIFQFE